MRESLQAYCLRTGKERLLKEWAYDLNDGLTPENVTSACGKRVWWRCALGHTWQAAIYSRSKSDYGCPYCGNHRVWPGFNDLASRAPEIAEQWYQPMNGTRTPETTLVSSHFKAVWRCPEGHLWRTEVLVRTVLGCGCPACVRQFKRALYSPSTEKQQTDKDK